MVKKMGTRTRVHNIDRYNGPTVVRFVNCESDIVLGALAVLLKITKEETKEKCG